MAGPLFAAVQVLTAAVWRMNAAMWANPWVLFAAAVAGAAYAIYANWGPITAWFDEQMTAISAAFDRGLGSGLWEIFTRFNAFTLIAEAVNGLSKWLFGIDLFAAGRRLMQGLIEASSRCCPTSAGLGNGGAGVRLAQPQHDQRRSRQSPAKRASEWLRPIGATRTLPQPPAPGSPAAMAGVPAPQKSEVKVKVEFANTPQGATGEGRRQRRREDRTVGRLFHAGQHLMPARFDPLSALEGSFRGFPFKIAHERGEGGRRGPLHEYPDRDEPFFEDLGRRAKRFELNVYFVGDLGRPAGGPVGQAAVEGSTSAR